MKLTDPMSEEIVNDLVPYRVIRLVFEGKFAPNSNVECMLDGDVDGMSEEEIKFCCAVLLRSVRQVEGRLTGPRLRSSGPSWSHG